MPGKSKIQTIEEDCAEVFHPLCEYAGERGVNIALENWFATNIQALTTGSGCLKSCRTPTSG